jgi:Bifunctional DNA primase/polymerase, N-terminal
MSAPAVRLENWRSRFAPVPSNDWAILEWNAIDDKRNALRRYTRLGLHVHLLQGIDEHGRCTCGRATCVKSAGKHPLAANWQIAPFNFETMDEALTERRQLNLGWRMGPQLNGSTIICFDVDGPLEILSPLEAKFGKLPATLTATTGRGFHLFFKLAAGSTVPRNTKLAGIKEIDVRSTGGQVVISPSTHYSGAKYRWLTCIEPAEIEL